VSGAHPDFERAPREHQWQGKLALLSTVLREKAWRARGKWAWFVVEDGTLVAMRVVESSFKRELRISRRDRPANTDEHKLWEAECAAWLRQLDCERWVLQASQPTGGIEQVYLEDRALSGAKRATQ